MAAEAILYAAEDTPRELCHDLRSREQGVKYHQPTL
jgi:hypothetical protein